ncbi:MAG: hypothetical protein COT81_03480 [Candidatus Buchananbacteria bacterium CG10_big_fil_rev_8_21_14_0_10_42_9]|uniref:SAM-dependent methyltransferase n=1 Tax=Candidatus Buchananbacteria bacterium CG10_big_fil_rev_8_21_14_0_10_42_9 TaxID=1974526 RepID=A0A2H0W0X3_9BACT|nr:MAG: hypothetical protein COT81_03480 [Candidatus Buchananbacteria bacterium CG10_big_fil_rev_8_21_14_0_10_42_9]
MDIDFLALAVQLLISLFVFIILLSAVSATVMAAPWVPTRRTDIKRAIKLTQIKPGQLVYELGCGDGRVCIEFAKTGARVVGFENSIIPYIAAQIRVARSGLGKHITIKYKNFFKIDYSKPDVIYNYLSHSAMKKLEPKFQNEMKPGSKMVSYVFPFPNVKPTVRDKPDENTLSIYVYEK